MKMSAEEIKEHTNIMRAVFDSLLSALKKSHESDPKEIKATEEIKTLFNTTISLLETKESEAWLEPLNKQLSKMPVSVTTVQRLAWYKLVSVIAAFTLLAALTVDTVGVENNTVRVISLIFLWIGISAWMFKSDSFLYEKFECKTTTYDDGTKDVERNSK